MIEADRPVAVEMNQSARLVEVDDKQLPDVALRGTALALVCSAAR